MADFQPEIPVSARGILICSCGKVYEYQHSVDEPGDDNDKRGVAFVTEHLQVLKCHHVDALTKLSILGRKPEVRQLGIMTLGVKDGEIHYQSMSEIARKN